MTLILAHAAHPQAVAHSGPGFGRLLSPRQCSRAADTAAAGIPWAADNDAYRAWDETRYSHMIDRVAGLPRCLFCVAPDVVAHSWWTVALFWQWLPTIQNAHLPPAFVIQDGQPAADVPWSEIGALFVGGTTEYKLGVEAERLVREAKRRGLWVHVGRVNSRKRYDYARAIGADSIDGTSFSMFRDTYLPRALTWHREHLQERIAL